MWREGSDNFAHHNGTVPVTSAGQLALEFCQVIEATAEPCDVMPVEFPLATG
jgi:hypothetical protein